MFANVRWKVVAIALLCYVQSGVFQTPQLFRNVPHWERSHVKTIMDRLFVEIFNNKYNFYKLTLWIMCGTKEEKSELYFWIERCNTEEQWVEFPTPGDLLPFSSTQPAFNHLSLPVILACSHLLHNLLLWLHLSFSLFLPKSPSCEELLGGPLRSADGHFRPIFRRSLAFKLNSCHLLDGFDFSGDLFFFFLICCRRILHGFSEQSESSTPNFNTVGGGVLLPTTRGQSDPDLIQFIHCQSNESLLPEFYHRSFQSNLKPFYFVSLRTESFVFGPRVNGFTLKVSSQLFPFYLFI